MSLSYDEIVNGLLALGVPRPSAEASARRQLVARGEKPPEPPSLDDRILEKQEQAEVMKLFRAFGFNPRNLSQPRATKQAPGLADLWVVHRTKPIAFWWETKRQVGGALEPAQLEFRDDCLRCGVGWGSGHRYDAGQHLVALGLAQPGDGPCGVVPIFSPPST